MSRRTLASLTATVLVVAAAWLLVPAAGARTARPFVPVSTYLEDVQAAAAGLTRFGTILQNADDLDQLKAHATEARTNLRHFDRRVYVLSRYRLRDRALDRQRAKLARTGPPVTAVLSRFLDAAVVGDAALVTRLLPVVVRRIDAFQRAAGG